jgi:hypothetical protein
METVTPEEARDIFDREAQSALGISGQDFIRRWDAGEFNEDTRTEVIRVSSLLPFGRR